MKSIKIKLIIIMIIAFYFSHTMIMASVVSDNDGSAFITKSEFDSLRSTFQSQINQYNTSIDSKIDNAIASYLSGIQTTVSTVLTDYNKKMYDNNAESIKFIDYGTSTAYPITNNTIYGEFALYCSMSQTNSASPANKNWWMVRMSSGGTFSGDNEWFDFGTDNAFYFINISNNILDSTMPGGKAFSLANNSRYHNKLKIKHEYASHQANNNTFPTDETAWLDGMTKSFNVAIPNYNRSSGVFPSTEVRSDFGHSNTSADFTSLLGEEWIAYSDTSSSKLRVGMMSSGAIPNQTLVCVDYLNRSIYDGNVITYTNMHSIGGVVRHYFFNDASATTMTIGINASIGSWPAKLTMYDHKKYSIPVSKLINVQASNIVSKPVYFYMGLPLTKVTKEGEITLKARFYSESGNDVKLTIMDTSFDNTATPTTKEYSNGGVIYDHVLYTGTNDISDQKTIKFNKKAVNSDTETLWFRLEDASDSDSKVYMLVDEMTLTYTK